MTKKILISGATGFVGSYLVHEFFNNSDITIITKNGSYERLIGLEKKIKVITYDDFMKHAFSYDLFIHCATNYIKNDTKSNIENLIYDNIIVPYKVISHFSEHGLQKVINTGTCFEYDFDGEVVSEKSIKKAFNEYALSKIMFQSCLESMGLDVLTLKLMTPYGSKDNRKLVQRIIESCLENKMLNLSEGHQKLDLVHITDVVEAYKLAADYILKNSCVRKEFIVSSEKTVSIREIVSLVQDITARQGMITFGEKSKIDFEDMLTSNLKIRKELGWSPRVDLKQGLQETIVGYKNARL